MKKEFIYLVLAYTALIVYFVYLYLSWPALRVLISKIIG